MTSESFKAELLPPGSRVAVLAHVEHSAAVHELLMGLAPRAAQRERLDLAGRAPGATGETRPATRTSPDMNALPSRADVVVVGAGHNGLVAATFLARSGLSVVVVEAADTVGGAAKTEQPFPRVPGLSQSTGAYLLGLMPPELPRKLGVEFPVLRRDPHYFLPTTGDRYLLFGSDRVRNAAAVRGFLFRCRLEGRRGAAGRARYVACRPCTRVAH